MKKVSFVFFLFILPFFSGCVSIPIGDGDSVKLSTDGVSVTSEDGEEVTIQADEENNSFSIQGTDEDGNETGFHAESSGEIPADFPDDIPIPKEAAVKGGQDVTSEDSRMLAVVYEVEGDDIDTYMNLYRDYLTAENYEVQVDADYGDDAQLLSNKEHESLSFMIAKKEASIEVMINYMILPEE